ncbi:MAG: succinate dehydrogenase, hydrophobic membrane anchor protein, partial [Sphingomonas sp.]|nr:succinate dehydrogenase, hydrophobic membrane anchor protein [Sphingomonas sp.]
YQHGANRTALMVLLNFFVIGVGATAIFSILKIAFSGAAA